MLTHISIPVDDWYWILEILRDYKQKNPKFMMRAMDGKDYEQDPNSVHALLEKYDKITA